MDRHIDGLCENIILHHQRMAEYNMVKLDFYRKSAAISRKQTHYTPILRIGDQVLTFDVFWPKHLQEVRSTVYIHVQSI